MEHFDCSIKIFEHSIRVYIYFSMVFSIRIILARYYHYKPHIGVIPYQVNKKKSGPLSIFVKFDTNMDPIKTLSYTKI